MNLIKLVSSSSIILGVSFILRFALTFVLAKLLSAAELGIYSWAVTVFGILGIITNFGLDFFLMRKVPEYRNSSTEMLKPLIQNTQGYSIRIAFFLILIIFPLSYFSEFLFQGTSLYNKELMIIIIALPFAAASLIFSTSIRAFDFPIRGQFIESIIQTGILFLIIVVSFTLYNHLIPEDFRTLFLVIAFVFSWVLSCLFSFLSYRNVINLQGKLIPSIEQKREWRKEQSSILFGILGWSILGRSDIFLLAFLVSPSEIGSYFIYLRLASLLMFFSSVAYYVWGGEISNLIQSKKFDEAQNILKKSSQLCILTTLSIGCFAFIFTEEILSLFNESYLEDAYVFKIAIVIFFMKGASGIIRPIFYILGEQDFLAKCQWVIGIIFTISILVAVPQYGLLGCIVPFGICEITYTIILLVRLYKKHNLSLSPV